MSPEQCRGTRGDRPPHGHLRARRDPVRDAVRAPPFVSEGLGELFTCTSFRGATVAAVCDPEVRRRWRRRSCARWPRIRRNRFQSMEELAEALRNRPSRDLNAPRVERGSATLVEPATLRTPGTPAVPTPARTLQLPEEEPEPARPRAHASGGRASMSGRVGAPVTPLSASAGAASLPPRHPARCRSRSARCCSLAVAAWLRSC